MRRVEETADLILSLFPGIGLLDRAFEEEGFTVVRGPDVLWGGDIRTFHPPAGVFGGVIGGPPCQAFSTLANLVRAKGHEPRFGNLIPEFERVVDEAEPAWFLMENVPGAPTPDLDRYGYGQHDFVVCNSWMGAEDGFGQEQERKRRFTFGVRYGEPVDLRQWIKPAALLLPAASAVLGDARETPVKLGGSGKVKRSRQGSVTAEPVDNSPARKRTRQPAVVAGGDDPPGQRRKTSEVLRERQKAVRAGSGLQPTAEYLRERIGTVTGGGQEAIHEDGRLKRGARRTLAEMNRLQGLPEDFLADAPLTVDGKRKAIANGVPLPLGRAVAAAIRKAL